MKKNEKQETKKKPTSDDTVMYKPIQTKKVKSPKEPKGAKGPKTKKKHPHLKRFFKVIFVMCLLMTMAVGGVMAAIIYRCTWGDWKMPEDALDIKYENSTMYDKDGNVVAVLTGNENREIISKEDMSQYIPKAFISIEDERFEEHHGVDWYRTLGAFVTFITHKGESSFGGSTITQQVVKNVTGEDDNSMFAGALRKVKEIVRAYQVEDKLSKDQILELYLNLIPLGGGGNRIYGVQTASRYYFNKNAKDVTVAEAAYIAGITSAPERYNPFNASDEQKDKINKKVKTVLKKMQELGKITGEEYDSGIAEVDKGIAFSKGEVSQNNKLSYYLEAARDQIIQDLMQEKKWTEKEAELHLFGDGYHIYTALDPNVQKEVDEQFINNAKKWYITKNVTRTNKDTGEKYKEEVQRQGSMVVIDNSTGYIVAGAGGLGEKTVANGINRMDIKGHSPGSCMKPIGVVGPCLEEGIITIASSVDDVQKTFGSYAPLNWYNPKWSGYMNMREIIMRSSNVPEVTLLQRLTVPKSLSYLEKMGVNVDAEADVGLSLALGGMTNGMTMKEMAAAYATVQNGGVYRTPLYYTKITDNSGNTVFEPKQEEVRVFSEQNAWLLLDLLKEPIYGAQGTGGSARISGQDVRGKTGTTNGDSSSSFCGITKYYTASVWLGFDSEADGNNGGNANSGICARLYQSIMSKVHNGKEKQGWNQPSGITTAVVCRTSGKLSTEECKNDPEGNKAYSEYFKTGTVPTEYCSIHQKVAICKITGKRAGENCKEKEERVFITREDMENTNWQSAADAKYMPPADVCTECKLAPTPTPTSDPNSVGNNTINNIIIYPGNTSNSTSNSIYTNTYTNTMANNTN
ncbi:MAG: penicillin-binding protein [Clostridia bacterium]|nr:penicillin-binding protein [Clostridia bacterium]MCI9275028.1 penicillin-binding protein [Clostridia bacterium]